MTKSILVVEDEDSIAEALAFLIGRHGYQMQRVNSGPDALEAVILNRPDLVLLDVMLPGCSGYEVCESIRSAPACEGVKILMMTARGGAIEERKAMALGADAFIAKPFSCDDLTATLDRLLKVEPA